MGLEQVFRDELAQLRTTYADATTFTGLSLTSPERRADALQPLFPGVRYTVDVYAKFDRDGVDHCRRLVGRLCFSVTDPDIVGDALPHRLTSDAVADVRCHCFSVAAE